MGTIWPMKREHRPDALQLSCIKDRSIGAAVLLLNPGVHSMLYNGGLPGALACEAPCRG